MRAIEPIAIGRLVHVLLRFCQAPASAAGPKGVVEILPAGFLGRGSELASTSWKDRRCIAHRADRGRSERPPHATPGRRKGRLTPNRTAPVAAIATLTPGDVPLSSHSASDSR